MSKAVILVSGGIDSTTCLAIARSEGFDLYALSFNYNQNHGIELDYAKYQCKEFGVKEHKILEIDLGQIGGSALTSSDIEVPKDGIDDGIPVTYVPARNTILLSFAMSWSEVVGADTIFIGVNAVDYSGYPDCRPEYIESFEKMANMATKRGVEGNALKIRTPLINDTKKEIIRKGLSLGVNYEMTSSCYDPIGIRYPCSKCDSCRIRMSAFEALSMIDPALGRKVK